MTRWLAKPRHTQRACKSNAENEGATAPPPLPQSHISNMHQKRRDNGNANVHLSRHGHGTIRVCSCPESLHNGECIQRVQRGIPMMNAPFATKVGLAHHMLVAQHVTFQRPGMRNVLGNGGHYLMCLFTFCDLLERGETHLLRPDVTLHMILRSGSGAQLGADLVCTTR